MRRRVRIRRKGVLEKAYILFCDECGQPLLDRYGGIVFARNKKEIEDAVAVGGWWRARGWSNKYFCMEHADWDKISWRRGWLGFWHKEG